MTPGGSEKFWTRRELGVKNFGSVLKEGGAKILAASQRGGEKFLT